MSKRIIWVMILEIILQIIRIINWIKWKLHFFERKQWLVSSNLYLRVYFASGADFTSHKQAAFNQTFDDFWWNPCALRWCGMNFILLSSKNLLVADDGTWKRFFTLNLNFESMQILPAILKCNERETFNQIWWILLCYSCLLETECCLLAKLRNCYSE